MPGHPARITATGDTDKLGIRNYLRFLIRERFNWSELKDLTADLGIVWNNLENGTLDRKIHELLLYCERHERTAALIARCRELRPDEVRWPEIEEDADWK